MLSLTTAMVMSMISGATGSITSFDLGTYSLASQVPLLEPQASEASAVTFNHDTGTLFVLGDEGDALLEVTTAGVPVSSMTLTGFDDTEGLTYIGGGRFVIIEERLQDAYLFTYAPGGTISRASLPTVSLGPTVGNIGLEGISYDAINAGFITVKEKSPQNVAFSSIDFTAGTATFTSLFSPNLGVLDLSDVQVLSTVPGLIGTPDQENLLILSQESGMLLEVSRDGAVLSSLNISALAPDFEGVTIGPDGTIYVVSEGPYLWTFVPTPGAACLLALSALTSLRRRRA